MISSPTWGRALIFLALALSAEVKKIIYSPSVKNQTGVIIGVLSFEMVAMTTKALASSLNKSLYFSGTRSIFHLTYLKSEHLDKEREAASFAAGRGGSLGGNFAILIRHYRISGQAR